jgi:hypothetical protein
MSYNTSCVNDLDQYPDVPCDEAPAPGNISHVVVAPVSQSWDYTSKAAYDALIAAETITAFPLTGGAIAEPEKTETQGRGKESTRVTGRSWTLTGMLQVDGNIASAQRNFADSLNRLRDYRLLYVVGDQIYDAVEPCTFSCDFTASGNAQENAMYSFTAQWANFSQAEVHEKPSDAFNGAGNI